MSTNRKRCFVIMPFSATSERHTEDYWNSHFELFLKPLIESCNGMEALRSTPLRQDIVRQIINDLTFSNIVVADLTDSNPNVYWELGVRQSFRHGTITIAEEGSKIPFDIATKSVLFYSPNNPKKNAEFSEQFRQAIMDCLSHPDRPDSVVLETVTGRGSIYAIIHREELVRRVDGLIAENRINSIVLEGIYKNVYKDLRKHFWVRKKDVTVTRLSSCAIDLLLAEHYLEEDSKFYESMNSLLTMVHSINHFLSIWDYESSEQIEKWFLARESFFREYFKEIGQKMVTIHQKLISSV